MTARNEKQWTATPNLELGEWVDSRIYSDEDIFEEEVEKTAILKTLEAADGNKSEAARRLGITRKTLHKKLKAYGVMP